MSATSIPTTDAGIDREVVATIARVARVPAERLTPEVSLKKDLRFDSLLALKVLAALEKRFGVTVPDEEIDRYETVGAACEVVRRLLKEKA